MSCVDIGMSHDWPRGIYHHGNTGELLRSKPFFRDEVVKCACNVCMMYHVRQGVVSDQAYYGTGQC